MIKIELLSKRNFSESSLDSYVRKQDVKRVYRKERGKYILVDMPYVEDWTLEQKRQVAKSLSDDNFVYCTE